MQVTWQMHNSCWFWWLRIVEGSAGRLTNRIFQRNSIPTSEVAMCWDKALTRVSFFNSFVHLFLDASTIGNGIGVHGTHHYIVTNILVVSHRPRQARMTNPNGNMPTESTPLLLPPDSEVSSETLVDPGTYEQENDKASQAVGKSRAILIILSLWVLIFLQSRSIPCGQTTEN